MHEYIRVCVDDDTDARAGQRAGPRHHGVCAGASPGASKEHGYRAHFARLSFDAALNGLEEMRDKGAADAEPVDAFLTGVAASSRVLRPA
ncbi:MAG: hypothetical protein U0531_10525 [Dehalococcoidia bacterium]